MLRTLVGRIFLGLFFITCFLHAINLVDGVLLSRLIPSGHCSGTGLLTLGLEECSENALNYRPSFYLNKIFCEVIPGRVYEARFDIYAGAYDCYDDYEIVMSWGGHSSWERALLPVRAVFKWLIYIYSLLVFTPILIIPLCVILLRKVYKSANVAKRKAKLFGLWALLAVEVLINLKMIVLMVIAIIIWPIMTLFG